MCKTEAHPVAIIGAGPVGMTLALFLSSRGIQSVLLERRTDLPAGSMAIGITPPSLDVFELLSLKQTLIDSGVPVRSVDVFERGTSCGTLRFSSIPSATPFVLSLPQSVTMKILRERVEADPSIDLKVGWTFLNLEPGADRVNLTLKNTGGECLHQSFLYVVGADGSDSAVRNALELPGKRKTFPHRFFMADCPDRSGWGAEAKLFFDAEHSLESFPLPGENRRWVIGSKGITGRDLETLLYRKISEVLGKTVSEEDASWSSHFTPEYMHVNSYGRGRVFLAGDAAHVTTPIGGQGMNVGIADAVDLSRRFERLLNGQSEAEVELKQYTEQRGRAFRSASQTGMTGMWLGTRTGGCASWFRGILIRRLLSKPIHNSIARRFSMTQPQIPCFPSFFRERSECAELMDDEHSDPQQFANTLKHFTIINRLFTRTRSRIKTHILDHEHLNTRTDPIHIVDFGAGGGDLSLWMLGEAEKRGLLICVTAIDQDFRCIEYMETHCPKHPHLKIVKGGIKEVKDLPAIDYLIGNHVLHHLRQGEINELLQVADQYVHKGILFSDLRRSCFAWWLFNIFARPFFRNSFIVEDGLHSIRRSFAPGELSALTKSLMKRWDIFEKAGFPFRIELFLKRK